MTWLRVRGASSIPMEMSMRECGLRIRPKEEEFIVIVTAHDTQVIGTMTSSMAWAPKPGLMGLFTKGTL